MDQKAGERTVSEQRKTRPVGDATERAEETAATTNDQKFSQSNDTTERGQRQGGTLFKILPSGKENAVPGWKLVEILGLKDLRDLTQLVERERRDGSPICASTGAEKGYYLADGPEELEDYLRSLNQRVKNINRTVVHLEDTLSNMTGQQRIGGD